MPENRPALILPPVPRLLTGQLAYHTRVLLRTPRAVIGGMLLPILLLLLRNDSAHATDVQQAHLVAGLATFGVLSTAYITHTSSLVAARQAGVVKRWRATPLPAWCYFAARIVATTLLATIGGALTALVGIAAYHLHCDIGAIPYLVVALIVGAAAWASIGTAASALIPTVEAAWPLLGATYLPIVILSGSFGTVSSEPRWLTTIMDYLPVQPIITSATRALLPATSTPVISTRDLGVLAAWAATGLLVSQRWFCWAPRTAGGRSPHR